MSDTTQDSSGRAGSVSAKVIVIMSAVCGFLTLSFFIGDMRAGLAIVLNGLMEISAAVLVLVAAGGFGHLAVGRIIPRDTQPGLRVITACGVGLSILTAAILTIGTFAGTLQNRWLWWIVIIGGAFLAVFQGRKGLQAIKSSGPTDARSLIWLVFAAVIGIWLAGAMCQPGSIGVPEGDAFDILEYHLQVPREYYDANRITELRHNCYSYYPMGVEMLFLLSMSLRGGVYEGAYLAQVMHGMFGVLAAATLLLCLRKDDDGRARFSAGLLATTPAILYLSWLAMSELAMIFYLAVAAVWLRQWLKTGRTGAAACIGLMAGCACATKYLAILFVAGPLLAVMILAAMLNLKKFPGLALAVVLGILPAAPWLVRNAVYTGDPVFPLATNIFGTAHWSAESAQRWNDGHGPQNKPPVPVPPGWKEPQYNTRIENLVDNLLSPGRPYFGMLTILLAGLGICVLAASTKETFDPWELCLAGILAAQIAAWLFLTHQMPWRFIVPAMVPISLLAGGVLKRLAGAKMEWLQGRTSAGQAAKPAGRLVATAIFVSAVAINMMTANSIFNFSSLGQLAILTNIREQVEIAWPEKSDKMMLVGASKVYCLKPGTIYSTTFDAQPLDVMIREGLTPVQIADKLRAMGITHIAVDWKMIWWMAGTYGFPASLSSELYDRRLAGQMPGLKILDEMKLFGLEPEYEIPQASPFKRQPESCSAPAESQPASGPTEQDSLHEWRPFVYPKHWPAVTVYKLLPAGVPRWTNSTGNPPADPESKPPRQKSSE